LIRDRIEGFLRVYDTPSAVLDAPDKELEAFIDPLGLQEIRRKAVKMMSHDFFAKVCPAGKCSLPPWKTCIRYDAPIKHWKEKWDRAMRASESIV
jgi:hypothetical protein